MRILLKKQDFFVSAETSLLGIHFDCVQHGRDTFHNSHDPACALMMFHSPEKMFLATTPATHHNHTGYG